MVLRPMIGEPVISVIMVTIGLSTVFQALMKWIFGTNLQPFPPVFQTQAIDVLGLQIQTVYLMSLAVSIAMMGGMAWFFSASKHGLAMRATAFDQQVAQSLGISVKSVFAMAWAISAVVSAVAGVVVAVVNGVSSGLSGYGIKVFPAAILGGLDSVGGAVLGGVIIGILENLAHFVDSQWLHWGNLYEVAPFYVLIVILMIKPYGLFGTREVERLYRDAPLMSIGEYRKGDPLVRQGDEQMEQFFILEGMVKRNKPIRVLRDNVVIFEGELESLRRFKEAVEEVRNGMECGIGVKQYNDVRAGDQIECFERIEVKRTL